MGRQQEHPIKYYGEGSHGLEVGVMMAGELKWRFIQKTTIGKNIQKKRKQIDTNSY